MAASVTVDFDNVAVLPNNEKDNVAVAKQLLLPGTRIRTNFSSSSSSSFITVRHPVLEGHRFAVRHLDATEPLLSWGLPFGHVADGCSIEPGDYCLNHAMLRALRGRKQWDAVPIPSCYSLLEQGHKPIDLAAVMEGFLFGRDEAAKVNFVDPDVSANAPFQLTDNIINAIGPNIQRWPLQADDQEQQHQQSFAGFPRGNARGSGTRNLLVVMSLSSLSAPFVYEYKASYSGYFESHWWKERKNAPPPTDQCIDRQLSPVSFVTHTEGEARGVGQHNINLLLRCICGYVVHPNVAAMIIVHSGVGEELHLSPDLVTSFAKSNGYPIAEQPFLRFFGIENENNSVERQHGDQQQMQQRLHDDVLSLLREAGVATAQRVPCPLRHLRIALQCGGSDAFSGVSGNPLAGRVAASFMQRGGSSVNLAEAPELVGAEKYILSAVADRRVAQAFVATTEEYKRFASGHGQTAAGNPSGGNLFRGLYNIVLKSIGAAQKKPPSVALDGVLQYAELMPPAPALSSSSVVPSDGEGACQYFFMTSPGNDLESIAGQVATGCNVIFFITGNGAMTNFPFVPTVKIVTTSARFAALRQEMDIDAGRALANTRSTSSTSSSTPNAVEEGASAYETALSQLSEHMVGYVEAVVSGRCLSKGEEAMHSQVSLWRNWAKGEFDVGSLDCNAGEGKKTLQKHRIADASSTMTPSTKQPICHALRSDKDWLRSNVPLLDLSSAVQLTAAAKEVRHLASSRRPKPFAVIVPTSLCSSEIGKLYCKELNGTNKEKKGESDDVDTALPRHWVCPAHTEGCAAAGDVRYERIFQNIMVGYATHPLVGTALFLEHGCEKTHNDYFRSVLQERGLSTERFAGFVSVQQDGGIEACRRKIRSLTKHEDANQKKAEEETSRNLSIAVCYDLSALNPRTRAKVEEESQQLQQHTLPALLAAVHFIATVLEIGVLLPVSSSSSAAAPMQTTLLCHEHFQSFFSRNGNVAVERQTMLGEAFFHSAEQSSQRGVSIKTVEIEPNTSWAETVTAVSASCPLVLVVSDRAPRSRVQLLSGSIISPTVRCALQAFADPHESAVQIAADVVDMLRQVLECTKAGSEEEQRSNAAVDDVVRKFLRGGDFVIPRGVGCVSL